MFKDCKSGGYNLEGSQGSTERLTRLVMLIALAYTISFIQGKKIREKGQQTYISRLKEIKRSQKRHSNFWIGIYGFVWTIAFDSCEELVNQFIELNRHKLSFYCQGKKVLNLIKKVY